MSRDTLPQTTFDFNEPSSSAVRARLRLDALNSEPVVVNRTTFHHLMRAARELDGAVKDQDNSIVLYREAADDDNQYQQPHLREANMELAKLHGRLGKSASDIVNLVDQVGRPSGSSQQYSSDAIAVSRQTLDDLRSAGTQYLGRLTEADQHAALGKEAGDKIASASRAVGFLLGSSIVGLVGGGAIAFVGVAASAVTGGLAAPLVVLGVAVAATSVPSVIGALIPQRMLDRRVATQESELGSARQIRVSSRDDAGVVLENAKQLSYSAVELDAADTWDPRNAWSAARDQARQVLVQSQGLTQDPSQRFGRSTGRDEGGPTLDFGRTL